MRTKGVSRAGRCWNYFPEKQDRSCLPTQNPPVSAFLPSFSTSLSFVPEADTSWAARVLLGEERHTHGSVARASDLRLERKFGYQRTHKIDQWPFLTTHFWVYWYIIWSESHMCSGWWYHLLTAETARSAAMLASLEQAPIMGIGDAWRCKLSAEKLVCRLLQIVFVLGGPVGSEGAKAWTCALTIWSRTTTLFFKLCSLMFVDLQFNNEIPKSAHTNTKTKLFFFLLQSLEWCQDWMA